MESSNFHQFDLILIDSFTQNTEIDITIWVVVGIII